jgi:hypothetical protein
VPPEWGKLEREEEFVQRQVQEEKIEAKRISWAYFSENLAILPHI